jgi:5-methylcytosine-specific restriction protein B
MAMTITDVWIQNAKEHFKNNGGKPYSQGDELSEKSKSINQELQSFLVEICSNDDAIVLKKQGSKWAVQGQKILNNGIWYYFYSKKYGDQYPIVLGVHIGKSGLNVSIQLNNLKIGDLELSELLGKYVKVAAEKYPELKSKDRDEKTEKYSDYGYFDIEKAGDHLKKIFNTVLGAFKNIPDEVNSSIFKKMIEFFYTAASSQHCKIDHKSDWYDSRCNVKDLVDEFVEEPTEPRFKEFWNRSIINSVQRGSDAANIIKFNGSITELSEKINFLRTLQKNEAETNQEFLDRIQEQIKYSKKSSLELYYYYHMENDNFPLINTSIDNAIKIIERNSCVINGQDLIDKMATLKGLMLEKNSALKRYYLVDQFLNLIAKIKYQDINRPENSASKELYQLAYLFSFWQKQHQTNTSEWFDELIGRSNNIIFYGAPGTGKTYSAEENIRRIIDQYPNETYDEEKRFNTVIFHPSYSYEDFMEGLKPVSIKGGIELKLKQGDFSKFCDEAKKCEDDYLSNEDDQKLKYAFFFLVDEINRAELSRVFGELMYCLEKRGRNHLISTQYSYLKADEDNRFYIPENIYFIGTMNDVDKSIDSFDLALRRRFLWHRMDCDYSVIKDTLSSHANVGEFDSRDLPVAGYIGCCFKLNKFIIDENDRNLGLGKLYEVGHAYFLDIKKYAKKDKKITKVDLNDLFDDRISPLLKEYLRSTLPEKDIDQKLDEAKKLFIAI